MGCNCRKPGVAIGNPSPVFPVYYTYNQCNTGDIRVSLNLFYEKDGAYVFWEDTGHELYVPPPFFFRLRSMYFWNKWWRLEGSGNVFWVSEWEREE